MTNVCASVCTHVSFVASRSGLSIGDACVTRMTKQLVDLHCGRAVLWSVCSTKWTTEKDIGLSHVAGRKLP